ncbi:MAG: hypothetical protein LBR43_00750 [Spiroplasmataceae bacterium]|jgi:hypothetical protein|nr:hypothetical protein [Spiroplasmataceae bacterium]
MTKTKKKIFKTETTKKKITKNLPIKPDKKQKTESYYQCMCQVSKGGKLGNITKATKFCKTNAPEVMKTKQEETKKILVSLAKILNC